MGLFYALPTPLSTPRFPLQAMVAGRTTCRRVLIFYERQHLGAFPRSGRMAAPAIHALPRPPLRAALRAAVRAAARRGLHRLVLALPALAVPPADAARRRRCPPRTRHTRPSHTPGGLHTAGGGPAGDPPPHRPPGGTNRTPDRSAQRRAMHAAGGVHVRVPRRPRPPGRGAASSHTAPTPTKRMPWPYADARWEVGGGSAPLGQSHKT